MISRRALLGGLPLLASGQATRKFVRSYFYLKPETSLLLVDFAVGSDKRAWALGGIIRGGKPKGAMISTSDGGQSWQEAELQFLPQSLFALDDSSLWAVSDRGEIWYSAEGGREWKKLGRQQEACKVHFLNNQTGFLVGRKKAFMRSEDGGKSWRHIPEGSQVGGNADEFSYNTVNFWNGKIGLATGGVNPDDRSRRRRGDDLPDWMEPETASYRNTTPRVMVSLETRDGGATWSKQEVSGFGHVHRAVIGADATGLLLVKFNRSFDFGGELYSFYPSGSRKGELLVRSREFYMQDVVYVPGDGAYIALTERLGILPVPTKVRIRHSKDLKNWTDIAVDYRAVAQKVVLSATPSGKVFAALDQGTILALQ